MNLKNKIFDISAVTYEKGNIGSKSCQTGSTITDTKECELVCKSLAKTKMVSPPTNGKDCYIDGAGKCKQDGLQESGRSNFRLVCKTLGNMIICRNSSVYFSYLFQYLYSPHQFM